MVPLFCVLTLLPWPPDHGDIHSVLPDHPPGRLDQKKWGTDFQFYRRALGPSTSASDSTIFKTRNETTVNDVLHAQSSAPRDAPCDAGGFCDDSADLHGKPHFLSGRPQGDGRLHYLSQWYANHMVVAQAEDHAAVIRRG